MWSPEPGPRQVAMPLRRDAVVEMLSALGVLDNCQGVVDGLREGLDVGALAEISHTVLFPESYILQSEPRLYICLKCTRASRRKVLPSIRARDGHQAILNFALRTSPKAALRQNATGARHVLPTRTRSGSISELPH